MTLAKKDLKKLYIAYKIGSVDDNIEYCEPIQVNAVITDVSGSANYKDYGKSLDYDLVLHFEIDSKTQFIDEFTKLWIGITPLSKNDNSNYEIVRCKRLNNIIYVYANAIAGSNTTIYYLYNNIIYGNEIIFNKETLKGSVPLNKFLPIDNNSIIWYRKPIDENDTSYRIKLVNKIQKDNCYLLSFELVKEN